jgi:hypothetical protein
MLVVQHNAARSAPISQAALEAALESGAGVVCLQEPGLTNWTHAGFIFYWPTGPREHCRVVTAIRRDVAPRIVVNACQDLVDHPYFIVVDVLE